MPKNPNDKALPHGGTLEQLFTGNITAKIMDFLSIHREYDYSKQDIAKFSGVSIRHTMCTIEKLEQLNLVKHTRNVGHSHMYKYNTDNPIAMLLQQFTLQLAMEKCQKIADQITQNKKEEKT